MMSNNENVDGEERCHDQPTENALIKRPSLFVIEGILQSVNKGINHRARFQEIAKCTPELRNRGKLVQYLKLLVDELGWLEKKDEVNSTPWNPARNFRRRRWTVSWYTITTLGKSFLELFPAKAVEEEEDEGLPTPEEQARNWKEWLGEK